MQDACIFKVPGFIVSNHMCKYQKGKRERERERERERDDLSA